MPNPLAGVLESQYLYSWVYQTNTNGVVNAIATNNEYKLSFKPVNTLPRYIILKSNDLSLQHYHCWILTKMSFSELSQIIGFGTKDKLLYQVVSTDQSTLKAINKTFGLRCICQRLV